MGSDLIRNIKIVQAIAPIHATTGHAITATEVYATGWSRAIWIINVGAMDALAVGEVEVQSSASSGGTFTDVTSAALTDFASTAGSAGVYLIEHAVEASYPYLKLAATCGTARAVVGGVCLLYQRGGGVARVDHGAREIVDL